MAIPKTKAVARVPMAPRIVDPDDVQLLGLEEQVWEYDGLFPGPKQPKK